MGGKNAMKQQGFYVFTPAIDWFFVTDKKNKTKRLAQQIAEIINGITNNQATNEYWVFNMMLKGTIEKKEMQPHGVYFDIKALDGTWSAGDFLKDKLTQIVTL